MTIHVGIGGWTFAPWRGVFYPAGLPQAQDPSFADPAYVALCRDHGVALAIVESDKHPVIEDVTADFVYLRLEQSQEDEPTGYPKKALDRWAERLRAWEKGGEPDDAVRIHPKKAPKAKARDVFCYFISGAKQHNPAAAMAMMERLKK